MGGATVQGAGRNEVVVGPDGVLTKHHGGDAGHDRAATAAAALRHARAHGLPVPAVRSLDGAELRTEAVTDAATGATLLDRSPVLAAIGAFARRLHDLPPPPAFRTPRRPDRVWVHGDLCPVNVLFDGRGALVAVVDWEDSTVGDPLVDLAWTEWLVRTWHPRVVPELPALYAAYGAGTPASDDRRRAIAACLVRHRARETTSSGRAVWDRHLADLDALELEGIDP